MLLCYFFTLLFFGSIKNNSILSISLSCPGCACNILLIFLSACPPTLVDKAVSAFVDASNPKCELRFWLQGRHTAFYMYYIMSLCVRLFSPTSTTLRESGILQRGPRSRHRGGPTKARDDSGKITYFKDCTILFVIGTN